MQATSDRILGFDGVRGIAAFAVVVHHAAIYHTALGRLGVLAFFVLSGYLIVGILNRSRTEVERGSIGAAQALKDFWWRRLLRIAPAYYVALAIVLLIEALFLTSTGLAASLPWYLAYLQNFQIALVRPDWDIFTHTWTLAVEQQFYVVFAALLLLAVPSRRHVLAVAAALACGALFSAGLRWLGLDSKSVSLLPTYGIMFLAGGGLLALAAHRLPRALDGLAALSIATLFLVWQVVKGRTDKIVRIEIGDEVMAALTLLALVVALLHILRHQQGPVVRLLELRPLRYLGEISYGLYIWHYPIACIGGEGVFNPLARAAGLDPGTPFLRLVFFLLVLALSLAAASLSWHRIERPLLKLKSRTIKDRGHRDGRSAPAFDPAAGVTGTSR